MSEQLNIAEILQSTGAMSATDGERIELQVRKMFDRGDAVEVSFGGLEMATTAFVNALVIPLYEAFDSDDLDERVVFVDTDEPDKVRISRARERGIERRANPQFDNEYWSQAVTF